MKHLISLFSILFLINNCLGQTTAIPDSIFEQVLIDYGIDEGEINGIVLTSKIDTITELDVSEKSIKNLTGIENFKNLSILDCSRNELDKLDLSQNNNLEELTCSYNKLTELDLANNIKLKRLLCGYNDLNSLNISMLQELTQLICSGNSFSTLDLTNNVLLEEFTCRNSLLNNLDASQNIHLYEFEISYSNNLTCLNLKNENNKNIENFEAVENPNLDCISVNDVEWCTQNWLDLDPKATFSDNCNVDCVVGLNFIKTNLLSIYPNPNSGNITINISEKFDSGKISITNHLGQIIHAQEINNNELLDISNLVNGMYNLQFVNRNGDTYFAKFIKK